MATILIAWELGGNWGHVMGLLPIAHQLHRQGHHICFAVRDIARAVPIDDAGIFTYVQSPLWLHQAGNSHEMFGYVDILAEAGYTAAANLKVLVGAWRQLIALTKADLIICEHAPTAALAARIERRRWINLGTGFTCPPQHSPLPSFVPLAEDQRNQLNIREQEVLSICNEVLKEYRVAPLQRLADFFVDANSDNTLLCTYPELDHYGARIGVNYYGPLYSDWQTPSIAWPHAFEKNIFVYLNNLRDWPALQKVVRSIRANVVIAAMGSLDHEALNNLPNVKIFTEPLVGLQTAIQHSDLVICHGGLGTTANALALSKPVLLLPTQKEQLMLAQRIASQNLGAYAQPGFQAAALHAAIESLLENQTIQKAVARYAMRHSEPQAVQMERIAQRIDVAARGVA